MNCVHAVVRRQIFTVPPTGRMPPPVVVDAAPPEIPPQVPVMSRTPSKTTIWTDELGESGSVTILVNVPSIWPRLFARRSVFR
jgi:hypothetical protein